MSNVLDEFLIALGLKSDGLKKGMKDAENTISQGVSSITSKLGALGAAFTAAMSIGTAFNQYVQQADAMGKLADAIGANIEKIDAWGEATARAGGSSEAFQATLQSLTGQLARQATVGTSRTAKLLEGAGIDAGEIGRQRKAFDVLMDLARKAGEMSKEEFFGLGRSLGIDQGTIMLLQQGETVVKDQLHLMKELGVYTKEDARVTAEYNDAMANLGKAFRSFAGIIFRMILPGVKKVIDVFTQFVVYLRKHETFVKAFFITVATLITTMLIPAFVKLAAVILANPLTWVVVTIAALALAIEDLVVWAQEGESAFGDLWTKIFDNPENARDIWDNLQKSAQEFFDKLPEYLAQISGFFEAIAKYDQIISTPFKVLTEDLKISKDSIEKLKAAGDGFIKFVMTWNEILTAPFTGLIEILKRAKVSVEDFENLTRSFFGFVSTWDSILTSPIKNFISWLESAKNVWDNTIGKLEMPSLSLPSFGGGNAEQKADGGIVTRPTYSLIGEAGAEAVIPFSPGKRNRGIELLSKIAGAFGVGEKKSDAEQPASLFNFQMPNFEMPSISLPNFEMPEIHAAQALPMGGATTNNNINTDTRVNVGTVNIHAENGTDAANQFMTGIENRAQMWTAAANAAY